MDANMLSELLFGELPNKIKKIIHGKWTLYKVTRQLLQTLILAYSCPNK